MRAAQGTRYTYGDYRRWPEEQRCELIDGMVHDMTPAPARGHQAVSGELFRRIADHVLDRPCEVYAAPFDVRLPEAGEVDDAVATVVQPDITVVCDPAKLDERGCRGAPDWIVEVLSPATAAKDQTVKLRLYERHGVREYWVVHPTDGTVMVRVVGAGGRYGVPEVFAGADTPAVHALPGLAIDLGLVFRG